jgi:hypothetical protein
LSTLHFLLLPFKSREISSTKILSPQLWQTFSQLRQQMVAPFFAKVLREFHNRIAHAWLAGLMLADYDENANSNGSNAPKSAALDKLILHLRGEVAASGGGDIDNLAGNNNLTGDSNSATASSSADNNANPLAGVTRHLTEVTEQYLYAFSPEMHLKPFLLEFIGNLMRTVVSKVTEFSPLFSAQVYSSVQAEEERMNAPENQKITLAAIQEQEEVLFRGILRKGNNNSSIIEGNANGAGNNNSSTRKRLAADLKNLSKDLLAYLATFFPGTVAAAATQIESARKLSIDGGSNPNIVQGNIKNRGSKDSKLNSDLDDSIHTYFTMYLCNLITETVSIEFRLISIIMAFKVVLLVQVLTTQVPSR